jgi:hypothetical protein
LIEALADLIPEEVINQQKRTFTLPWEHWLRNSLMKEVASEFDEIAQPLKEALNSQAVCRVWTSFLAGRTSWSRVWSLVVLNRWTRRHLVG